MPRRGAGEFTRPRGNARHDGARRYESSHWGRPHGTVWDVDDPDLPRRLVEMGKLELLVVRGGPRGGLVDIEFPAREDCMLCFDTRQERLYVVLPPAVQAQVERQLWERDGEVVALSEANARAGGRLGGMRTSAPSLAVQPLGEVVRVEYFTSKGEADDPDGGEDVTFYHEFEAPYSVLCVDSVGRLWMAGGSSLVPDEGIAG